MTPEKSNASWAVWFLAGITTAGMIFFASLCLFAPKTVVQRAAEAPAKTSGFDPSLLEPELAPPVAKLSNSPPASAPTNPFDQSEAKPIAQTASWWRDSTGIHFLTPSPAAQPKVTPALTADDLSRIEAQSQALDEASRDNDLLLKWSLEDTQIGQQWSIESDLQDLTWSVQDVQHSVDRASQQQSLDSIWKR